jgi:hypothetical protein
MGNVINVPINLFSDPQFAHKIQQNIKLINF